MSNAPKVGETHDTGLWWDTQAEKLVTKEPVEGRQIVAKGVEVTNAEAAAYEYYTAATDPKEVATLGVAKETRKS